MDRKAESRDLGVLQRTVLEKKSLKIKAGLSPKGAEGISAQFEEISTLYLASR